MIVSSVLMARTFRFRTMDPGFTPKNKLIWAAVCGGVEYFDGRHLLDESAFLPDEKNDLKILRSSLMTWLEPFERVEADDWYEGEAPHKVKCPSSSGIPEKKHRIIGIVRRRQETVNMRFKQWSILNQVFRHDLCIHGRFFTAIVVISQLAIENDEPLFQVEYDDAA